MEVCVCDEDDDSKAPAMMIEGKKIIMIIIPEERGLLGRVL